MNPFLRRLLYIFNSPNKEIDPDDDRTGASNEALVLERLKECIQKGDRKNFNRFLTHKCWTYRNYSPSVAIAFAELYDLTLREGHEWRQDILASQPKWENKTHSIEKVLTVVDFWHMRLNDEQRSHPKTHRECCHLAFATTSAPHIRYIFGQEVSAIPPMPKDLFKIFGQDTETMRAKDRLNPFPQLLVHAPDLLPHVFALPVKYPPTTRLHTPILYFVDTCMTTLFEATLESYRVSSLNKLTTLLSLQKHTSAEFLEYCQPYASKVLKAFEDGVRHEFLEVLGSRTMLDACRLKTENYATEFAPLLALNCLVDNREISAEDMEYLKQNLWEKGNHRPPSFFDIKAIFDRQEITKGLVQANALPVSGHTPPVALATHHAIENEATPVDVSTDIAPANQQSRKRKM